LEFIPLSEEQKVFDDKLFTSLSNLKLKLKSQNILLQRGFDRLLCLDEIFIEPKPWQIETALKVLRDMGGSGILADEVGLGKTIECGLIIKELLYRKLIHNILILVPAPLVEQWIIEMKEKFNIDFYNIRDKGWEEQPLLISSLPLVSRSESKKEVISQIFFDLIVVDEAHNMKNQKTIGYKFVYNIQRKNTILMTATPIQNEMSELYNLINLLKPGILKSRAKFRKKYMLNKFTPKNTEELKNLLNDVMVRHRRSNTLVGMPRRIVKNIEVELDDNERKFHNGVIAFCKDIYHSYFEGTISLNKGEVQIILLILISLLKQNCSSPHSVIKTLKNKMFPRLTKAEDKIVCEELINIGNEIEVTSKAKKILEFITESDEQYLVYTEYRATMEMLKKYFEKNNILVTIYHGGLNGKDKQKAIQKFKNQETRIFVATESGGQGLNLQFCHKLINYDLPWNPMKIEQRIGRIHRFGQTHNVEILTFPTKGTIDEYILYVLTAKLNLFEMVIGELDTIMSYMLTTDTSLELQIGKIILNSNMSNEIEDNLRLIGDNMLKAKNDFEKDVAESSKILNKIGVGDK
jgi:SNF2 family DNA or RNA helicase